MKKKLIKEEKEISPLEKKSVWTFFTLFFPSLLLCLMLMFPRTFELKILALLLFFYQAVLLKNFIEKYYEGFI